MAKIWEAVFRGVIYSSLIITLVILRRSMTFAPIIWRQEFRLQPHILLKIILASHRRRMFQRRSCNKQVKNKLFEGIKKLLHRVVINSNVIFYVTAVYLVRI